MILKTRRLQNRWNEERSAQLECKLNKKDVGLGSKILNNFSVTETFSGQCPEKENVSDQSV